MTRVDLNSISIDELWALHEEVSSILITKMRAEKLKLENWLKRLGSKISKEVRERRPYPKAHPRFRNPDPPHQTWSGRGKQPLWISKLLAQGTILDDLRI
jgi:DNA-binding protein H-NS